MCTCIYTYALRCAATATGNIMPKNALCELSMAVSCVGHTPCARRIHMCTQQTGPQTQIANRTWHKTRMHAHTAHDAPWTCANKHGKYESSHEPLPSCTLPRQSSSGELRAHITGSLPSYPVTNAMTHGICAQHPIYIATLPASTPQSRMPQAIMSRGKGVAPIAHYLMRLLPHPTTALFWVLSSSPLPAVQNHLADWARCFSIAWHTDSSRQMLETQPCSRVGPALAPQQ